MQVVQAVELRHLRFFSSSMGSRQTSREADISKGSKHYKSSTYVTPADSTYRPCTQEMVDFLVDVWDQDGLYD